MPDLVEIDTSFTAKRQGKPCWITNGVVLRHALVALSFLSAFVLWSVLAAEFAAPAKAQQTTTQASEDEAQTTEPVADDDAADTSPAEETTEEPPTSSEVAPTKTENSPVNINDIETPEIQRDLADLPFPTRRMRELILEAARSGDVEKLRPYIGYGDDITMLSLGGIEDDPVAFLKTLSGDPDGHEILAILIEVLEAGYVVIDERTENELYVWPYFFAMPLDKLTDEQRVELFSIVTYGDYEDMKAFGAYIFYRVGITPEGRWRFFVAGD